MAACDDCSVGSRHLDFLRRLQPHHFGIPCADWLRVVMNRIGPDLLSAAPSTEPNGRFIPWLTTVKKALLTKFFNPPMPIRETEGVR